MKISAIKKVKLSTKQVQVQLDKQLEAQRAKKSKTPKFSPAAKATLASLKKVMVKKPATKLPVKSQIIKHKTRRPKAPVKLPKVSVKNIPEELQQVHIEQQQEAYYPPVIMLPQTLPNGTSGPYCQLLFHGTIVRQVQTGYSVPEDRTDDNGKVVGKLASRPIMTTVKTEGNIPVWCRVIKGNERNGEAIVVIPNDDLPAVTKGAHVQHTGGGKNYLAKAIKSFTADVAVKS